MAQWTVAPLVKFLRRLPNDGSKTTWQESTRAAFLVALKQAARSRATPCDGSRSLPGVSVVFLDKFSSSTVQLGGSTGKRSEVDHGKSFSLQQDSAETTEQLTRSKRAAQRANVPGLTMTTHSPKKCLKTLVIRIYVVLRFQILNRLRYLQEAGGSTGL